MDVENVRNYCLSLKNATEALPFDDVSLVFKVENKMFLLLPLDADEPRVAVKCDPDLAEQLRDQFNAVRPAYHFNKKHWNDIFLDSDMKDQEIKKWILHSYQQVIRKLPRHIRSQYDIN